MASSSPIGGDDLVLIGPVVSIDGRQAFSFSTSTTLSTGEDAVVSIYDADTGLIQFSVNPFSGGLLAGEIDGRTLSFSWEGREFEIRSRAGRPILRGDARRAYVRFTAPSAVDVESGRGGPWISSGSSAYAGSHPAPPRTPVRPVAPSTRDSGVPTRSAVAPVRPEAAVVPARPEAPHARRTPPTSPLGSSESGVIGRELTFLAPTVTLDGRTLNFAVSAIEKVQSLYLYEPGVGLFVVRTEPWESDEPAGTFDGRTLRFSVGDHEVVVVSERPILVGPPRPAYAQLLPHNGNQRSIGGGAVESAIDSGR